MVAFSLWILYISAAAIAVYSITQININRPTFIDGLSIGLFYYIIAPMLFIMLDGTISPQFILTTPYRPYENVETTLVILSGSIVISIFHILVSKRRMPASEAETAYSWQPALLPLTLSLFFATTIATFFMSGLHQGGHWASNATVQLETNGAFLIIKHLSNFARTAIFGVLLLEISNRRTRTTNAILIGSVVVFADLFLTFNRITAVYFLVMLFMIYRSRPILISIASAMAILSLSTLSNMWPMFRGLATTSGYTVDGMISAANTAVRYMSRNSSLSDATNGVFESINIVTLNHIVNNVGETFPYQYGAIFLRPITFFLPTMVWPDRPLGFALLLGESINHVKGAALNSTLFGEPFANFGFFWPIFFLPLLWVYDYAFRRLADRWPPAGFIAMFCAVAMWRFDSVFGTISFVLACGLAVAASAITARRARIRQMKASTRN